MKILTLIAISFLVSGCATQERWKGYVYLDATNVSTHKQTVIMKTLEDCREASKALVTDDDTGNVRYVCKLNCKILGDILPYCEEAKEYILIGTEVNL